MVKNGEFFVIKDMQAKGMYVTHIAKELGRDPKTIRKWLKQDEPQRYQRINKRIGKLDAYKSYVRQRMEDGCLNAVVIYDEIKTKGFIGSITALRYFMRPLKPIISSKATARQASKHRSTGVIGINPKSGYMRLLWYLVIRASCLWNIQKMKKVQTLIGCHERAMTYFGGITRTCLYDNMKTVVKLYGTRDFQSSPTIMDSFFVVASPIVRGQKGKWRMVLVMFGRTSGQEYSCLQD